MRFLSRLAAGAMAVSVLSLAPLSTATAATRATSHLTSTVAPATVLTGASVVVSGVVTPSVAGSPLVLQRLLAGRWVTKAHVASSASGHYSFKVVTGGKVGVWSLRVVRAASSKATAVTGRTLRVTLVKTAYKISALTVTKVNSGDPIVVTGAVAPKTTGKVYLQVLAGGKWKTLTAAKLASSKYSLSMRLPAKTYALRVLKPYNKVIATGESRTLKVTVFKRPTAPKLKLTSPDDATLGEPGNRLVFSTVRAANTPGKSFTFTNTGGTTLTVKGLALEGANTSSFVFATGQAKTLVIPPGGHKTVTIYFRPTATTNCPFGTTYPNAFLIGDSTRTAALTYSSSDPGRAGGSAPVAGINSCRFSSVNEPVLDQVLSTLGYTDVITTGTHDRRNLTQAVHLPGSDEITAHYFKAANTAQAVTLRPLAHYSSADTHPYHQAGWYAKGAALGSDPTCVGNPCNPLWQFPGEATVSTFTHNQKLLPAPAAGAVTSFHPVGAFGVYLGEHTDVNFTDDNLNLAHGTDNKLLTPTRKLHDIRVYPAYGVGHVLIPHTYILAVDVTRVPASKNDDFQDVVMILRNATPVS